MTERKTIYLDDALEAIRKLPNAGIHWFVSAEAVFDALLKLPSAQPYTDEEIKAMQDLEQAQLDKAYELGLKEGREALRQGAIDAIELLLEQSEDDEHDKIWNNAIRGSINAVKHHVPSAQLEVILCGDCKHWICHDRRCGYWNHKVGAIDWCSHGERRTYE